MAGIRIPVIQRQTLPSAGGQPPLLRDTGGIGPGLMDAGRSLSAAAGDMEREAARQAAEDRRMQAEQERVDHEQRKARVTSASLEARMQWTETAAQRELSAEPGAPGHSAQMLKDFDAYTGQRLASAKDPQERDMLTGMLQELRFDLAIGSRKFEYGAARDHRKQLIDGSVDTAAKTVTTDPAQFHKVLAPLMVAIGSSTDLSAGERMERSQYAREKVGYAAAYTLAERDPEGFLKRTTTAGDPIIASLSPEGLRSAITHANTTRERIFSEQKYTVQSRAQDVQAMAMNGQDIPAGFAPSRDEAITTMGAHGADWWQANVGNYIDVGQAMKRMRGASADERMALVAGADPVPGAGFAAKDKMRDILAQAAQTISKRLQDDPAVYAAQASPRVQTAQAVLSRVLGDKNLPDADRSAAVDFYARTTLAEQERLGASQPRLLSKGQSDAIAQRFMTAGDGGKNAADLVAGLEQQWGKWWPAVYGQLAKESKMPAAALVIPNMADRGARARLATLAAMKDEDVKALLPSGEAKDVREKLQDQFADAASSFLTQGPGGAETVSKIMGQAEKLALFYRAKGASVADAAKQAFTETLGHAYVFTDTYRVRQDENPQAVGIGAEAIKAALDDVAPFAVPPGITPQAAKAQTLDAVRKSGEWISRDDETGLRLVARDASGQIYQVRRADGTPLSMTWGELRAAAMDARTVDALRQPRLPNLPKGR